MEYLPKSTPLSFNKTPIVRVYLPYVNGAYACTKENGNCLRIYTTLPRQMPDVGHYVRIFCGPNYTPYWAAEYDVDCLIETHRDQIKYPEGFSYQLLMIFIAIDRAHLGALRTQGSNLLGLLKLHNGFCQSESILISFTD